MTLRFLEIARLELDEAVDYYNGEFPGLGEVFLAVGHLHWDPDHWKDRTAPF
jgi:hypothetical protein